MKNVNIVKTGGIIMKYIISNKYKGQKCVLCGEDTEDINREVRTI